MKRKLTRRDMCWLLGRRGHKVTRKAEAWTALSIALEGLGERDMPKFRDIASAIRAAQIVSRRV